MEGPSKNKLTFVLCQWIYCKQYLQKPVLTATWRAEKKVKGK